MAAHNPGTFLNAMVCAVIVLRLFFFRRAGAEYVRWGAYLAYGLILAAGSVTICTLMGTYTRPTDPAELFINTVLCFLVLRTKGNVVQLFKVKRDNNV